MDAKTIVVIVLAAVGGLSLLVCGGLLLLLLPAVNEARTAARRTQARNNLKIIGLGLHNYHDVVQSFPPGGIYSEDGTPYHSWQTMLLPYVDQAALYDQIDLDRPWTDPVNVNLMSTRITEFYNPNEEQVVTTVGGAASHYAGNRHVLSENSSVSIPNVTDGTSNTIFAGEVAGGYRAWGDPRNVRDPADGIAGDGATFGGPNMPDHQCQFLLMDGSVRTLAGDTDPAVLRALATPAGAEELPTDF